MATDRIRYDKLVETALRGVVRDAVDFAATNGLPGNHHFYLTFRTGHPGVDVPEYLKVQYPDDMTIVLQHQFYGLAVEGDALSVSLSFNNVQERLTIPFAAIVTFADPSVNFALQFQTLDAEDGDRAGYVAGPATGVRADATRVADKTGKRSAEETEGGQDDQGKVVALDAFRKK